MRRCLLTLLVLASAVLVWRLLGLHVVGGSERFYLILPPTFLALYVTLSPEGWRGLRAHAGSACRYLLALTLFGTLYYMLLTASIAPVNWAIFLRSFNVAELLVTIYFLVAISLLVAVPLVILKSLCRRGADRLIPVREPDVKAPDDPLASNDLDILRTIAHRFVRDVMPGLLLLPILLPYLLGAIYVHRLKVANSLSPRELIGREYEDVAFTTADGLIIRGWFIPALKPSTRTLVICHGLGANRTNFMSFCPIGDGLEANVLIFDFRGHGDSDGHTVSFGCWEKLDVLAAADFLRRERPEQAHELLGLGISMGASSLAQAAAELEPPFDAVILDSCFASAVELTDQILAGFPPMIRPCLTLAGVPIASVHAGCWMDQVRPIDCVARVRAPLLIIHARGDSLIPAEHAERIFEQAVQPKLKWITDTGGHGSSWHDQKSYLARVKSICNDAKRVAAK